MLRNKSHLHKSKHNFETTTALDEHPLYLRTRSQEIQRILRQNVNPTIVTCTEEEEILQSYIFENRFPPAMPRE